MLTIISTSLTASPIPALEALDTSAHPGHLHSQVAWDSEDDIVFCGLEGWCGTMLYA